MSHLRLSTVYHILYRFVSVYCNDFLSPYITWLIQYICLSPKVYALNGYLHDLELCYLLIISHHFTFLDSKGILHSHQGLQRPETYGLRVPRTYHQYVGTEPGYLHGCPRISTGVVFWGLLGVRSQILKGFSLF